MRLALALAAPLTAALAAAAFAASTALAQAPVTAVEFVDLDRYAGRWYEIARAPYKFDSECVRDVVAMYSRRGANSLNVVNECRRVDGTLAHVEGIARVRDNNSNAKLEIRFAPLSLSWLPFVWNDYWILDVPADYSYVLIGEPNHTYLRVLARSPRLDSPLYERLLAKAAAQGYDTSKVMRTQQTAPAP